MAWKIETLDNFLISLIENWFDDEEVLFQDDDASCQRTKAIKAFLQERHIKSMIWPVNCLDLKSKSNWKLIVEIFKR